MKLKEIVVNAQYVTDESISDSNLLAMANSAIAHINTEAKCNLPFATTDNLTTTSYDAITDSWQLRLLEPYISYSIASNDTNDEATGFHYSRFNTSLDRFIKRGLDSIKTEDSEGVATGYDGGSATEFEMDLSEIYVNWWN